MAITEIDELEFETTLGWHPSICLIDSTHIAVAYLGADSDAFIKTFSFDGTDFDSLTEIDSLEHNSDASYECGEYGSLIKIDATHLMLAFKGFETGAYGTGLTLKTFSIDSSADNITEIDAYYAYSTLGYGDHSSLVMIDSTHFILAFRGLSGDGYIATYSIDGSYDNITEIDRLEHDTVGAVGQSLLKIDNTHFALLYNASNRGMITTFSIDGSYDTITQIDSHDIVGSSDFARGSMVLIDSTHLMVSWTVVSDDDAYIGTFSFDGSYDTITEIDSIEHDTGSHNGNWLTKLNATNYAISYDETSDHDGYIKTFSIDGSYDITENEDLTHETTYQALAFELLTIDETHILLAYTGDGNDGFLKTFSLSLVVTTDYDAYLFHDITGLTDYNGMLHAGGITNINGVT